MKPTNMNLDEAKLAKSTEHTPLPLKSDSIANFESNGPLDWTVYILDANGGAFCIVQGTTEQKAKANAALIVEAVNNYASLKSERDELRKACKRANECVHGIIPPEVHKILASALALCADEKGRNP